MSCPKVESLSSGATAQLSTVTAQLSSGATAQLSRVTGAFQIQVVQYTHDSSQSELSMAFMVVKVLRNRFLIHLVFVLRPY